MANRKKIAPIRWKATGPTRPKVVKKPTSVKASREHTKPEKKERPSGDRKLAEVRRPGYLSPGRIVKFGYRRPWANDPNPVVFVLYATRKAEADAYLEGINVRYMSATYWMALEAFVEGYPNADGEYLYYLIKGSAPYLLKAYRRYLYKRMSSPVKDASILAEKKAIVRKTPRGGKRAS